LHSIHNSMVQPAVKHVHEIVDLISDDEHGGLSEDQVEFFDAQSVGEPTDFGADLDFLDLPEYGNAEVDERDVIDLTAIPDVDIPPSDPASHVVENATPSNGRVEFELISEAVCLQLVMEVFPDVSVDHVLTMIQERTTDLTRTKEHSERIVNELLEEGIYPKEAESASKKRRRAGSEEFSDYEKEMYTTGVASYATDA
jgi:TRIAD3 protein (E3 ubiquitin-protein ligase RNF216)